MSTDMVNNAYMNRAKIVAEQSHCLRRKVGAVIVRDGRAIALGVNGPGRGMEICTICSRDGVPSGEKLNECYATHAEQAAIASAAFAGRPTRGCTMFVTHRPCSSCMKLIIAAGIKEVYFYYWYPDPLTDILAGAAGVKLIQMGEEK